MPRTPIAGLLEEEAANEGDIGCRREPPPSGLKTSKVLLKDISKTLIFLL